MDFFLRKLPTELQVRPKKKELLHKDLGPGADSVCNLVATVWYHWFIFCLVHFFCCCC